jgi:hypothetical protein
MIDVGDEGRSHHAGKVLNQHLGDIEGGELLWMLSSRKLGDHKGEKVSE